MSDKILLQNSFLQGFYNYSNLRLYLNNGKFPEINIFTMTIFINNFQEAVCR